MFLPALLALSLAGAPPPPPKRDVLTEVVKDAVGNTEKKDGLDVAKLPFTQDSIMQVVNTYQPQIQACYEEHLALKEKAIEGTLKTTFIITGDGLVKSAKVNKKTSSLKDARLHDCVVAVLSMMAFPKPPDGKDQPVTFPFNLKAKH
jgi:hypothetical protein